MDFLFNEEDVPPIRLVKPRTSQEKGVAFEQLHYFLRYTFTL